MIIRSPGRKQSHTIDMSIKMLIDIWLKQEKRIFHYRALNHDVYSNSTCIIIINCMWLCKETALTPKNNGWKFASLSCDPERRHQSKCRHNGWVSLKLDESLSNPEWEVKQVTVFKYCTQYPALLSKSLVQIEHTTCAVLQFIQNMSFQIKRFINIRHFTSCSLEESLTLK